MSGRQVRGGGRQTDAGGLWIRIGIAGGVLLYAGVVVMDIAGFTAILAFVIVPPVLVALIGANSLIGGGRARRRAPGGPAPSDADADTVGVAGTRINGAAGGEPGDRG